MEHTFIIVTEGIAFTIVAVHDDLANGRYRLLSTSYSGIADACYDKISDIEAMLDRWVKNEIIEAWYPLWNPKMDSLDSDKYATKVKRCIKRSNFIED